MFNADPFGSFQNFMQMFRGFIANPMQILSQRGINLPQNAMQNPEAVVNQLVASGQMTQAQFNNLRSLANDIKNNPSFRQMLGMK